MAPGYDDLINPNSARPILVDLKGGACQLVTQLGPAILDPYREETKIRK